MQLYNLSGKQKRVLFMISDTGGGHRAAACAIKEALEYVYPNQLQIVIVDVWKNYTPWPINRIGDSYVWMVEDGRWLWKLIWKTDGKPEFVRVLTELATPPVKRSISKLFECEKPDLVVSFHPLINHIPQRILENMKSRIPFATVVTDLVTAHPAWFCREANFCAVPTAEVRQRALRYGMPKEKVVIAGQPVALKFAKEIGCKSDLRHKLGLAEDRPTILILGGGEGMGQVLSVACAISKKVHQAQLMVVCGRNRVLKEQLEAISWEIPGRIFGFVDDMPDLMGAADVVVTKAGPSTISEAFIAGRPIILSSYIPGQEEGNVSYVQSHDAGVYEPDPEKVADLIEEWFNPNNKTIERIAKNAAKLAQPNASLVIAHHLYTLLQKEFAFQSS